MKFLKMLLMLLPLLIQILELLNPDDREKYAKELSNTISKAMAA